MHKRRSEDQLIRFVWSRNIQYDYSLLLEVQSRNPFSFKKPKPVWDEIAKSLREGVLKMKVNDRNCRERVTELLKKHRREEVDIMRSTGATSDKLTDLKKLLTSVNEMTLTKPDDSQSSLYRKESKNEGESIRNAALNEMSDTDSDDYLTNTSRKKPRHHRSNDSSDEIQYVTTAEGFFSDSGRSLEEEERIFNGELMENEVGRSLGQADQTPSSEQSNAGNGTPTTSTSRTHSVQAVRSDYVTQKGVTASARQSEPPTPTHSSPSNDRFSNPKKDLIKYLEKKSENECDLKREEIRIREMEATTRKNEVEVLRKKTEAEMVENEKCRELEAENKREELRILRLRAEADIEDRRKTQDLLISLLTKNNQI